MNGPPAYSYDALGRTTQVLHADGSAITYAYAGRATQVTDENGVSRISQVDGLGRTTAVCEISSNSSMPNSGSPVNCGLDLPGTGFLTTYTYNLAGHTTTVNQGGQIRTFTTDGAGRTVSVAEPESGTTNYSYAYAGSGGLGLTVTRTRPQANQTSASVLTTTTTQYDAVGRPVSVSYNDGITPSKSFTYDTAVGWWNLNLGASKGRLTFAETSASATMYAYDPVGRVTTTLQCLPNWCGNSAYDKWTPYSYDWMGNITSADDGSGAVSTYTYSPAGEVTSITSSLNDSTHPPNLVSAVQNGPDGPTGYQLGNGLNVARTYDSLGRWNGEWVCSSSSVPYCTGGTQDYGFSLGFQGPRTTGFCDTVLGICASLGYDDFNRLTWMNNGVTNQQLYSYVYDRWGNRWQQNALSGGSSFNVSFNTGNNQINTSGFSYDAAGNLTGDGLHTYTYDAEGNLAQVDGGSTATYQYSALNQRVQVGEGGNSAGFIYSQNGERSTIWNKATGDEWRGDTFWGNVPVEFNWSSQSNYIHRNWLDTDRMYTSYDGTVGATIPDLPFGDGSGVTGNALDPWIVGGMDKDYYGSSDSGTDHAQFRQYYDWEGRWMSPDPYSGSYDFSNPQSLNRYTYALNNPNVFTDPSGLDGCNPVENDGPCPPPPPPPPPPILCGNYYDCYTYTNPTSVLGPTGPGFPTASSFISHSRPASKNGIANKSKSPSTWEKIGMYAGCIAGMDPSYAMPVSPNPISGPPQDPLNSTEDTSGQRTIYGPSQGAKSGGMTPYNPEGNNSLAPDAASGGASYVATVIQCIENVDKTYP